MVSEPGAIALAALVLNAALMKHLVREGVIKDELKKVFENAASSLDGNPQQAEVVAILNSIVQTPETD